MRLAERALSVLVVLVMAGLVLVPISQVVMRGVFTLPFIGAEELTRFLLICLVFLAYPLVVLGLTWCLRLRAPKAGEPSGWPR